MAQDSEEVIFIRSPEKAKGSVSDEVVVTASYSPSSVVEFPT